MAITRTILESKARRGPCWFFVRCFANFAALVGLALLASLVTACAILG
jgi:hypothetical protein